MAELVDAKQRNWERLTAGCKLADLVQSKSHAGSNPALST